jgi:hypothetical protein
MKRTVDHELVQWKEEKKRKILLIRGARQVGKTYSVRTLGKSFDSFLEVNFEEHQQIMPFFVGSLNPIGICEKLSIYFGMDIVPGETLLFFDEIQACPNALRSLRFFYEKMQELHVIAAGSLLEFTVSEIPSFGVGRIRSLFMYPMTFGEYLSASGEDKSNRLIMSACPVRPIDPVIHEKILEKLKIFQITGGMPEVVKAYIKHRNFNECQMIIDDIVTTLIDDFAKYKKRLPVLRLQEVFTSIVHQAGNKFKFSNIPSTGGHKAYMAALDLLVMAGLAYKIHHTAARGLPLAAQINPKKFKVLVFDSGIFQRILGLDLSEQILNDFKLLINKGALSEISVGLELIAAFSPYSRPGLFYWHREARSSNAEIDYVLSRGSLILPLEVKAGTRGQMQSLHLFLRERDLEKGLRISHENFGTYDKIQTLPLYAAGNVLRTDYFKG